MIFNLTHEELVNLIYYVITNTELPPKNIEGNTWKIARWKLAKAMEMSLLE